MFIFILQHFKFLPSLFPYKWRISNWNRILTRGQGFILVLLLSSFTASKPKSLSMKVRSLGGHICNAFRQLKQERRKWHFTNFTGEPKQKMTIVWSDSVYWFQLFIIQMYTLMYDSTFASRKSSLIYSISPFHQKCDLRPSGSHPSMCYLNEWGNPEISKLQRMPYPRWSCLSETLWTTV